MVQNEKGSSLIEVVVAMVVLALLVTGLNACVVSLVNSNITSKEISSATSAGNQLLDDFRKMSYTNVSTDSDVIRNKYIRSWTVTEDSAKTKKTINLVVSWPSDEPRHAVSFSTIIAKP